MSAKDDVQRGVEEVRALIQAIESGALTVPFRHYLSSLRTILRWRENWLQGKVAPPVFYFEMSPEEREKALQQRAEDVVRGARMVTPLQALVHYRNSGYFQHQPLRPQERAWFDAAFCGRAVISLDVLEAAQIDSHEGDMGSHSGRPCRCHDYFQRRKRRA